MNGKRQKTRSSGKAGKLVLLFILLLLLAGTVALRVLQGKEPEQKSEEPAPSVAATLPDALPAAEESSLVPVPEPEKEPETKPETERTETTPVVQTPTPSLTVNSIPEQPDPGGKEHYTAETYKMVTDLVYAYRHLGAEGWTQVEGTLAQLNAADPKLGVLWDGIMRKWAYVREDMVLQPGVLPDGLPQDDTLCIAVMGHQLLPDGRMDAEMQKRCEIGLSMVEKYPNAFLAVTGGGTASANNEVTEAETMAEWFLRQGVSPDRMIVENRSMTTGQNARNTCAILTEQYPQVKEIAVVSSSYHIAQCELMFTEAALLYAYLNDCEVPYTVTGNACFAAVGNEEYSDPANLGADIWVMANPDY